MLLPLKNSFHCDLEQRPRELEACNELAKIAPFDYKRQPTPYKLRCNSIVAIKFQDNGIFFRLHHNHNEKSEIILISVAPQTLQRWEGTLRLWSFLSHGVLANIPYQDPHHVHHQPQDNKVCSHRILDGYTNEEKTFTTIKTPWAKRYHRKQLHTLHCIGLRWNTDTDTCAALHICHGIS